MIAAFSHWLGHLIKVLATHADNATPSLRKVLVLGIATLGLAMGVAFIALSVAAFIKTGAFDPSAFGTGAVQLLGALATLPLSLAKAMELVPDTTTPEAAPDEVQG
jgi:hypothetical protein